MGPPFLMCPFPSPGRLGPARAEVGLGFAVVGWFRRFRPPPPPLVWFRARRPPLFFSLAFSGFCPLWARCVVLVFALSLFSCVRLFASWLSNCHFTFTLSLSSHFHCHFICPAAAGRACVCVCTICIDVKLHIPAGGQQPIFLCCPAKLRKMWWMGSWTHEPVPALSLGAYKSQLGGTYFIAVVFYGQCLL